MLKQYLSIKGQYADAILFFRLGDFYEMFYEDAEIASKILEIALTSRNKGEVEPVPLCGIPYHACQPYIAKLLTAGKKVAICEQIEDPKLAKGVVKREVVRVITPGMVFDDSVLESSKSNYIVSLHTEDSKMAWAYLDISTGEFCAGSLNGFENFLDEVAKLDPKEMVLAKKPDFVLPSILISEIPSSFFEEPSLESMEGLECLQKRAPLAVKAAQALWRYACELQKGKPSHITQIKLHEPDRFLFLEESVQKNLELLETLDREKKGSLLHLLDETLTPMGARKLRQWLLYPLLDLQIIQQRQQALSELIENFSLQQTLEKSLSPIADLERLVARVAIGTANARDLVALKNSLERLPVLKAALQNVGGLLGQSVATLEGFAPLVEKIEKTLVEDPSFALKEGGLIGEGVHPELDALRKIMGSGKNFIAALEEKERRATGISSLKVRFNKIFGYYIEVTHTHREKIPPHYIRKQTLVNAERYITPELKEYEEKVLGAEERIHKIEYEIFLNLREETARWGSRIQKAAESIAALDALFSLSKVAQKRRWVVPKIVEGNELHIEEGRHPIVEALSEERFVPNDVHLDGDENRFLMITGPNMAGKSTVMRQTALIVILAQIGSFVPASRVTMGLVDRIFTRVGASDRLTKGESTFMVEMVETAHILKEATSRSLVIVDEVGRGTSTYDGVAIAWAVAEYLHHQVKAKTLFATHYHELIDLSNSCPGMKNFNIAVKEWNDRIIFLRKLLPGGTSKSYGVEVAKLAGLPQEVITRAKEILGKWEQFAAKRDASFTEQLPLFSSSQESVIVKELQALEINRITPLQALEILSFLKSKID